MYATGCKVMLHCLAQWDDPLFDDAVHLIFKGITYLTPPRKVVNMLVGFDKWWQEDGRMTTRRRAGISRLLTAKAANLPSGQRICACSSFRRCADELTASRSSDQRH